MNMSTVLGIDIMSLIQPLLIKAVFKGEEIPVDALIDILVSEKIEETLLASITIPSEWIDIVNMMLEMDKVKRFLAVLRGETPPEPVIDKIIELIVNLKLVESLSATATA